MPANKKAKTEEMKINTNFLHFRGPKSPLIGAHVSAANGVHNCILNASHIGCNSAALFLKNQRTWNSKPLSDENIQTFKDLSTKFQFNAFLPHGSYLINLGNPDEEKRNKSYDSFIDDLKRCYQLGINLYNFHPGSTVGQCTAQESILYISQCINKALKTVSDVCIVLENMAGQGNVIGSKFSELQSIIELVDDKSRIGVCLDTCHLFAAGYDVRTRSSFDKVIDEFDKTVGIKYLKGMHLNDSKGNLGSCKDRHENIGKGKIGIECFRYIVNDTRFHGIPLILETPIVGDDFSVYEREIELLYSLVKNTE